MLVGLLWLLVKVTQRREVRHRSLFPIHPVAPTRIVMVVMSKCTGTLTFVRSPSTIWCLTDFSATGYKFSDSGIVNLGISYWVDIASIAGFFLGLFGFGLTIRIILQSKTAAERAEAATLKMRVVIVHSGNNPTVQYN